MLSALPRVVPDKGCSTSVIHFVCLGHAKCGTTLLDSVFSQSRILVTPIEAKEIKFFLSDAFEVNGSRERYLDKFGVATTGGEGGLGTFEASPQYSQQSPETLSRVLQRIVSVLPEVRLVVCFRHPVTRAYSHYIHDIHKFALYGDQVFSRRPALLRRPFAATFEESLPRLARSYSTTLEQAIAAVGKRRVLTFFLERDASNLFEWVRHHIGMDVAADLGKAARSPKPVFARRPLPNYLACGGTLHAFGSEPGEYIRYDRLSEEDIGTILEARSRWTLELTPDDALPLSEKYFRNDLERCMELTGDDTFMQYAEPPSTTETAVLSDASLLSEIHGVRVPEACATRSRGAL